MKVISSVVNRSWSTVIPWSTNLFKAAPTVDDVLFILWFLRHGSISCLEAEHISHKLYVFSILGQHISAVFLQYEWEIFCAHVTAFSFWSWTRITNSKFFYEEKKISNASHSNKTEREAQDANLYSSYFQGIHVWQLIDVGSHLLLEYPATCLSRMRVIAVTLGVHTCISWSLKCERTPLWRGRGAGLEGHFYSGCGTNTVDMCKTMWGAVRGQDGFPFL